MRIIRLVRFSSGAILAAVCLVAFMAMSARARSSKPWMDRKSPFRAGFKVEDEPTHNRGGVLLKVPVCRMGSSGGKDVRCYDEAGQQLNSFSLGRGRKNKTLVLVQPRKGTNKVFAYFGSGISAPQASDFFRPSLRLTIHSRPEGDINEWEDAKELLEKSELMGTFFVPRINVGYNPLNNRDQFIAVFEGFLKIEERGEHTFFLLNDDAGYLFIDGERVISHNKRHAGGQARRGKGRETVQLERGAHQVKVVVVENGGRMLAVLARWVNKKKKYPLKKDAFLHTGKAKLESVGAARSGKRCPAFSYDVKSYMNYKGTNYHKVRFKTYNGKRAEWRFEDGARVEAAEFSRVIPGLDRVKVALRQDDVQAGGYVAFNEKPIPRRQLKNAEQYQNYVQLISSRNMENLNKETLQAYRRFLRYRPYHPELVPVCNQLLERESVKKEDSVNVLLDLARAGSVADHQKGAHAYEEYLNRVGDSEKQSVVVRHYAEFAMFGMRDFTLAERIIKTIKNKMSNKPLLVQLLWLDLELQRGNPDKARDLLNRLTASEEVIQKQRKAAVRTNALKERFYQLLDGGFLNKAREKLWEWQRIAPYVRGEGKFAVARARLWKRFGWYKGALADLKAAEALADLLQNRPEVLYERGLIRQRMGDTDRAEKLFEKIIEEYPDHPAATKAEKRLP